MTGAGSEDWCTFHIPTRPTPTTTTPTSGSQARTKTVLPTERGFTRSPFEPGSPPRLRVPYINEVRIRVCRDYQRCAGTRTRGERNVSPAGAVGSMGHCGPASRHLPQAPFQSRGAEHPKGEVGGGQHGDQPEKCPLR